ncbi:MAG: DUF192 domain-containing protein [bacterium]|nr:DUF192 domain-containing protein [bacterium]
MKRYVLRDVATGAALGAVSRADSPWERLVGLLGCACVQPHDGLWIEPCAAVHTVGMRCALDLIFLDRDCRVVALREAVKPNRLAVFAPGARVTIELGAGSLRAGLVRLGDVLRLEESALPS